jgi:hypothetical protein
MLKEKVLLVLSSFVAMLLLTIHLSDDVVRGMSGGGLENLFGILILLVWLYGTLMLADRRSGQVIILLGSLFASLMPAIHMRGKGVGGAFAATDGAHFFIWTIYSLGVFGAFAVILAVRALRRKPA